jgi:cadmium resistance protein CadD (predicted permease)
LSPRTSIQGGERCWLMVMVSLLAALGLSFVPLEWVGVLGLIPLARGVCMLVTSIRSVRVGDRGPPAVATGLTSVVLVTLANGGDNVSIYTSAFRIMGRADTAVTIAVFAVGTALWCLAGMLLVSHEQLVQVLQRSSRWIPPAVFILLGLTSSNAPGSSPRWASSRRSCWRHTIVVGRG